MKKKQFDVLCETAKENKLSLEEMAKKLFITRDEIEELYNSLCTDGYIKNHVPTKKGQDYLNSKKIDNAIILSAGLSTRFVPLNFEKPKSLLKVKGEVLIERQIEQLKEAGIKEIIVVVGYMKEQFEYLTEKYGVILVESTEYRERNNHSSVFAARVYLKNSIITSSDLYFTENIFEKYAFDSYYTSVYIAGKTAERGFVTDEDDRMLETFYGDRCYDIWVTLGYAFFSEQFSQKMLRILENEYDLPKTKNKFWADIQDEHFEELYMYAKRCDAHVINEFDSLEELREFDNKYRTNSGSKLLKEISNRLGVQEENIIGIESLRSIKDSMFKFRCRGDFYICDVRPDDREKISLLGRVYYQCRDFSSGNVKLFRMDKNIYIEGRYQTDVESELQQIYGYCKEFKDYHAKTLPLCAAENIVSDFVNLPLGFGFQERYIMNNTYSFNMDDNFIGCEKLFCFYEKISEICERIFGARYVDPRPFTGMHCIDMITKTLCEPGQKMMLLGKEFGGHASVKPVVERLGIKTWDAPYDREAYDLDYELANKMIREHEIDYILLAPSDIIKIMDVEKLDTSRAVLLYDCSQIMGLIAAGLAPNPLKTMHHIVMFGGTHKSFPGPASGLILTNDSRLHEMMETAINPKYLRHSQMHQKISLLFALIEFEQFGSEYMSHMIHCSNYLGKALASYGLDVADVDGKISSTHQIFIRTSKNTMETIYENAYKCGVTLNKKTKKLFYGYGIRLGSQEIARYDWNDACMDSIAQVIHMLTEPEADIDGIKKIIHAMPKKELKYTFPPEQVKPFFELM